MANGSAEDEGLNLPVIKTPYRKVWFLDGDLVRLVHSNRAAGIVTLYNMTQEKNMVTTMIEFKRKRKRAFTIMETAKLLNYHRKSIPRLVRSGILPQPTGELPGGRTAFHYLSYYSEDQIWEARRLLSQTHIGKPRRDGRITNNKVPTEQELRYAMGEGLIYYVRDDRGKFIPVFSETI